jgi:hypothetical protein
MPTGAENRIVRYTKVRKYHPCHLLQLAPVLKSVFFDGKLRASSYAMGIQDLCHQGQTLSGCEVG